MFDPDRQSTGVPLLADASESRRNDLLDHLRERHTIHYEFAGELARTALVARDELLEHAVGERGEP